ncbi:hypothetical protein FS837_006618 [Tulasnella sp. UAMH 9824]|nr:hypothetical protein FS837_006618 [Tulasnella sp. UAMH 9824]
MAELDIGGTTRERSPAVAPVEGLPGERELELEVLLKERDEHLTRLANEVRSLRRRLPVSEQPSTDEPFTLPSPLTNLLLPLLCKSSLPSNLAAVSGQALSGPASATVTAALTARLAALHQENEELYELLKRGAVGRLHEEVRELRVTARKLEGALQESHTTISQLKTELEEAYRVIERHGKSSRSGGKSRSRSPINHYKQQPQSFAGRQQDTKPIPTGPRALKKPRLSNQSQEYPSSSGYRSNGRSTPPMAIKQEEDSRMKVEEEDYETRASSTPTTPVLDLARRNDLSQRHQTGIVARADPPPAPKAWMIDHHPPRGLHLLEEAKADATRRNPPTARLAPQLHHLPTSMKLGIGATLGLARLFTLLSVVEGRFRGPSLHLVQVDGTPVLHLDSDVHKRQTVRRPVVPDLLPDFAFRVRQDVLRTGRADKSERGLYAVHRRLVIVEVTDELPPAILGLKGRENVGTVIPKGRLMTERKINVVASAEGMVMRLATDGESARVKVARSTVVAVVVAATMELATAAIQA